MAASGPAVMTARSKPPENLPGRPAMTSAWDSPAAERNVARNASMMSWVRALALPSSRWTTVTGPSWVTVTAAAVAVMAQRYRLTVVAAAGIGSMSA